MLRNRVDGQAEDVSHLQQDTQEHADAIRVIMEMMEDTMTIQVGA